MDRCVSINTKDPTLQLEYDIGKTTYPKLGKIFVFDTRKNAREFIKRERVVVGIILKVLVVGNVTKAFVRGFINPTWATCSDFWNTIHMKESIFTVFNVPPGTYYADAVTPIEKSH